MLMTKRKPAMVGEILLEDFMEPLALTQSALAKATGAQRKHVNDVQRHGGDGAYPRPRVRKQPGLLAERAAPQRAFGGDPKFEATRR